MSCAFCRVVAEEPEAHVYADPEVVGFLDIRPVFHGHLLFVPRQHLRTLADASPDLLAALFSAVQVGMAALERAVGAQGTFVAVNNVISQSVPHLHVHVVPRRRKDGLRGFFWPRHPYREGELEAMRERLREAVAAVRSRAQP
ncbi:MAG TPA: HIT family protein [Egibacteraceae bacterium]